MLSKEKIKFIAKVTIAHFATYMIKGMIFAAIFNYEDHIVDIGMKSMEEISFLAVVLAEIVRGLLFGIVLWWIKDSIIGKRLAWLRLWAMLIILGIINVYAPAPASIEGFLYLAPVEDVPLAFNLGSLAEVLVQPLAFSIIVTWQRKKKL